MTCFHLCCCQRKPLWKVTTEHIISFKGLVRALPRVPDDSKWSEQWKSVCKSSAKIIAGRVLKQTFWSWGGCSAAWRDSERSAPAVFVSSAPSLSPKEVHTQQTGKAHTHCWNKSQHMQIFSSFVAHLWFMNPGLSLLSLGMTTTPPPPFGKVAQKVLFCFFLNSSVLKPLALNLGSL